LVDSSDGIHRSDDAQQGDKNHHYCDKKYLKNCLQDSFSMPFVLQNEGFRGG
jgi:hypothetical protein